LKIGFSDKLRVNIDIERGTTPLIFQIYAGGGGSDRGICNILTCFQHNSTNYTEG
jgi:hypothetical protein